MKTKLKSILAIALCAVGLSAFAKPAAKLTNGEDTKNYAEEELYQLLVVDGLKDGDKLEFLQEVKVWDSDYSEQVYGFTAGSTIKAVVDKDGTVWDIDIAGQDAEIIDSIGTAADFAKNYRFANEDGCVSLSASVAGSFVAPVVEVCWDVEVTGVMKAEYLTVDMMDSITLKGKGCVYTTNNKIDSICDQAGQEIEAKDASSILGEGWYVYALDDDPPLPPLPPQEPVSYLDWDDAQKKMTNAVCTAYEVVKADTATFEAGKTYVVLGNVTNTAKRITVNGTVANPTRLILCDGAELVAKKGVEVMASGATTNALTICGQEGGTGALEALVATAMAAGIGGGGYDVAGGIVMINGGTVTAMGADAATGIGGGTEGAGGIVTINGGSVTATGGTGFGAGRSAGTLDPGTVTFGEGVLFSVVTGKTAAVTAPIAQEDYEKDHSAAYVHIAPAKQEISALSNVFAMDLTAGDRIAADEEMLVVDPAWGKAKTATLQIDGESGARTYDCASNDLWQTAALAAGRYTLALTAGDDNETAAFWKTGDDWVIFDNSNITVDVTFEAGKTYLFFGTNTVDSATLTVMDGAKLLYDEGAPAGFKGGTVAELPKRYGKKTVGDLYQIVEKIKGCEDNPWEVGGTDGTDDLVTAWTNGTELVISGEGTVTNLADVAKGGIRAVKVTEATVTGAAKDAFKGVGGEDTVMLTLPDGWQGELPDKDGKLYGMKVDMTSFTYPTAVKNVEFLQRYPWNGLVDIACDLSGEGAVQLTVTVLTNGVKLVANPTITGETTIDVGAAGGIKEGVKFIWNAANDLPAGFKAQNVKVKVTVEKAPSPEPPPAGQLWANGPIWEEANFGESEDKGHPEYGALYKFEDAGNAVAQITDGSRLPTKEEFEKLTDTSVCDQQWDATRKGYLFTGKGDYAASSIFLPAAGFDYGNDSRSSAEHTGEYWSSAPDPEDDGNAYALELSEDGPEMTVQDRGLGLSVRLVKDAK